MGINPRLQGVVAALLGVGIAQAGGHDFVVAQVQRLGGVVPHKAYPQKGVFAPGAGQAKLLVLSQREACVDKAFVADIALAVTMDGDIAVCGQRYLRQTEAETLVKIVGQTPAAQVERLVCGVVQLHHIAVLPLFVGQADAVGDQRLADLQGAVLGSRALLESFPTGGVIGKTGGGGAAKLIGAGLEHHHLIVQHGADLGLGNDLAVGRLQLNAVAAGGGQGKACRFLAQKDHPVAVLLHNEVLEGLGAHIAVGEAAAGEIYPIAGVVQFDIVPVFAGVVGNNGVIFGADLADLNMILAGGGGAAPKRGVQ